MKGEGRGEGRGEERGEERGEDGQYLVSVCVGCVC